MPKRPKRPCRQRLCNQTHRNSNGYCDDHQRNATNWDAYQARQGSTTQRGYGYRWERIKKRIIERDRNLCQLCLKNDIVKEANAVDHIVPKSHGGDDSDANLQCICDHCHAAKTARESSAAREGRVKSLRADPK